MTGPPPTTTTKTSIASFVSEHKLFKSVRCLQKIIIVMAAISGIQIGKYYLRQHRNALNMLGIGPYEPYIPRKLIFAFEHNILEKKSPPQFYTNIQKTITKYREVWNPPLQKTSKNNEPQQQDQFEIIFLDEHACEKEIWQAEPRLLPIWKRIPKSFIRHGFICKVAALYNHGGYFFGVDLEVVEPVVFKDTVAYATSVRSSASLTRDTEAAPVDTNFLASEPKHAILRQAFNEIMQVFEDTRHSGVGTPCPLNDNVGSCILEHSFYDIDESQRGETKIFMEDQLTDGFHTEIQRQTGTGGCCNFVVHDVEPGDDEDNDATTTSSDGIVHFFSRIVGSRSCCAGSSESYFDWDLNDKKASKFAQKFVPVIEGD